MWLRFDLILFICFSFISRISNGWRNIQPDHWHKQCKYCVNKYTQCELHHTYVWWSIGWCIHICHYGIVTKIDATKILGNSRHKKKKTKRKDKRNEAGTCPHALTFCLTFSILFVSSSVAAVVRAHWSSSQSLLSHCILLSSMVDGIVLLTDSDGDSDGGDNVESVSQQCDGFPPSTINSFNSMVVRRGEFLSTAAAAAVAFAHTTAWRLIFWLIFCTDDDMTPSLIWKFHTQQCTRVTRFRRQYRNSTKKMNIKLTNRTRARELEFSFLSFYWKLRWFELFKNKNFTAHKSICDACDKPSTKFFFLMKFQSA